MTPWAGTVERQEPDPERRALHASSRGLDRVLLLTLGAALYLPATAILVAHGAHKLLPTSDSRLLAAAATPVAAGIAGHGAALSCLLLQALLGDRILAAAGRRLRFESALEHALFSWLTGFVASTAVLLLLAAAGMLNAWTTALAVVCVAGLAAGRVRQLAEEASSDARSAFHGFGRRQLQQLLAAIVLLALAAAWAWPLLVQSLLPNSDWDSALYHLPLAERYLDGKLWNGDPLFSNYSFPGAVSLIYAALLSLDLEVAIIPLNFWVAVLGLVATCCFAWQLAGRAAAFWAGAILATTHIYWQLAVDPRIDGFLCLFILLAFYSLTRWMESGRRHQKYLFALALAQGAAIGCKYTGLLLAGGLSLATALLAALGHRLDLEPEVTGPAERPSTRRASVYLLLLLVPGGFWYAANLVLHGDPLFPMLRGDYYVDSAGRAVHLPSVLVPGEEPPLDPAMQKLAEKLKRAPRRAMPSNLFNFHEIVANPDAYSVKPNHFASPLLVLALFLPIFLPREPGPRRVLLLVYVLSLSFYVLLGSQTNLLRYAMPVFPTLATLAGIVVARVRLRAGAVAVAAAAAVLLLQNFEAERHKLSLLRPELYLSGSADRGRWLEYVGYNFATAMPAVVRHINRRIADGSMSRNDLILMVGEGKGRLLECSYQPDSSWYLQRWLAQLLAADLDYARVQRQLRKQGVTHILYNRGYFDWVVSDTPTSRARLAFAMVHLERFLRRYGSAVFRGAGMQLVRLQGERPETAAVRDQTAGGGQTRRHGKSGGE